MTDFQAHPHLSLRQRAGSVMPVVFCRTASGWCRVRAGEGSRCYTFDTDMFKVPVAVDIKLAEQLERKQDLLSDQRKSRLLNLQTSNPYISVPIIHCQHGPKNEADFRW
jgi:hypothetical protein